MGQQPSQVSCAGHPLGPVEEVLAAALEVYVCIDGDDRVVAWNPAAESTFGYTREQVCGQPITELIVAGVAGGAPCGSRPGRRRWAGSAAGPAIAVGGPAR